MTTVLVDLDGTITDSAPGIINAYRHAIASLGMDPPSADQMRWIVGPPARECFPKLIGPGRDIEHAVRLYRGYYSDNGLFDAVVYEGMHDALAALRETADRLFVCTAKPVAFAQRIVAHFEVATYFDAVYGAEFDGRFDDKGELLKHVIREERIAPQNAVMVGDRKNDILAASRNSMKSIGVTWGYGGAEELTVAGATMLCDTPAELPLAVAHALSSASSPARP
jgi:phosphoglycolate phosphatase